MLNLKHLYYFNVFAQILSTTKAAKKLGISAPALCNQLKQLEGFLGVPLTRRIGNKVVITGPGEIVLHYTGEMFSAYEELKNKISFSNDERKTQFRVGVCQQLGARFAFDLLSLIKKTNLTLSESVHMAFDSSENLADGFMKDKFDMIIGAFAQGGIEESNWISQRLAFPVKAFAACGLIEDVKERGGHPLQDDLAQIIEFANSKKISMVLPAQSSVLREETEMALSKLKIRPSRTIECNSSDGIVQLIERGFAFGLVPTPCMLDFKSAKSLKVMGPAEGFWSHGISALIPKGEEQSKIESPHLADFFSSAAHSN